MAKNGSDATVYAVGDVHGRYDLLLEVLAWIRADRDETGNPARLVMLGDYVDRGPESRKVIETLINEVSDLNPVCLIGNHEDMMLQAIRKPMSAIAGTWYLAGGRETLASYGWDGTHIGIDAHFPEEHVAFLESLPMIHEDADRIYVHAGLKPGVALADQTAADLLWIRHEFLRSDVSFGKLVVHGHTPVRHGPEILPNRINLDTKAYRTGKLTCAAFDPGSPTPRIFQTGVALAPVVRSEADEGHSAAEAMTMRL